MGPWTGVPLRKLRARRGTTRPDKHDRVFLVPFKNWLVQCTRKLDKSLFTMDHKHTAKYNWSPCQRTRKENGWCKGGRRLCLVQFYLFRINFHFVTWYFFVINQNVYFVTMNYIFHFYILNTYRVNVLICIPLPDCNLIDSWFNVPNIIHGNVHSNLHNFPFYIF